MVIILERILRILCILRRPTIYIKTTQNEKLIY